MSRKVNIFNVLPSCDIDALAFIAATGITDPTIIGAVCELVTSAKADGWWSKLDAIFPFVGGTADTNKYNLKDPQDLDSAFRLSFVGGWVHSANGSLPNGVNGYARTFWNPNTETTSDNVSFGCYSRTNVTGANYIYGSFQSSGIIRMWNNLNGNIQIAPTAVISYSANPSTKLFISRRDSSNFNQSYRDGVSLGTTIATMLTLPNFEFYFGAVNNNGGPNFYTQHEIAFGFLGNAITNADVANITSAVNTFQTSLSRNV
jgi:hypothetical protein